MGGLTALAAVVVAYTLVASLLRTAGGSPVPSCSSPRAVLGLGRVDAPPFELGNETVLTITELTLALLLFADASDGPAARSRG